MVCKTTKSWLLIFFSCVYIYNVVFVGTPAARMKKVPSNEVKKRSRELTSVFESFSPYQGMEGKVERIWITEIATDGVHLVSAYQFLSLIADYMFMPRVKLTLK